MKDEIRGEIVNEFVRLKSKIYSLVTVDDKEIKKAKGVNKNIVQSKLHRIGTYDVCKIYLSSFDDKRYVLDDGISSLAYFHGNILNQ